MWKCARLRPAPPPLRRLLTFFVLYLSARPNLFSDNCSSSSLLKPSSVPSSPSCLSLLSLPTFISAA